MFDAKSLLDGLLGGAQRAGASGGQSGGLGGLLGQVMTELQTRAQRSGIADAAGNVADRVRQQGGVGGVAGSVFNQATGGVRDAAQQIDQRTGASTAFNDLVGQASGGKTPAELIAQVREMAANNPGAATAVLGGLAATIFGTSTGRGLAMNAAKVGGLALIGGLAYRAWQNHQQGKPLLDMNAPPQLLPPPAGSGFEADAATNDAAALYIRAMIAASAADGQVDAAERRAIMGGLKESGLDQQAHQWLEEEIANPASVEDLVAEAGGDGQKAAQLYTAARIAIEPDAMAESQFLSRLARGLALDPQLKAQIDAAATAAKAAA